MFWKLIHKGIHTLTGRIIIKINSGRKMREMNRTLESMGYKQKDQQSQQEARDRARASDAFKALVQISWASPPPVLKRLQHKLWVLRQTSYGSFMLLHLCAKHL